MQLKVLLKGRFTVAGTMDGTECPAEMFITSGEAAYKASREGLSDILERLSISGFSGLTSSMVHEANKTLKVYEFIKGDLRLFFFKGRGDMIVVCTGGVIKKGQKADKQLVDKTSALRKEYIEASENNSIQIIGEEP